MTWLRSAALAVVLCCAPALASPAVTVVKDPPRTERKPFSQIPREQAVRAEGFEAYTYCYYTGNTYFTYDTFPEQISDGRSSMRIRIRTVELKLTMNTTIWLKENASEQLVAHELGHRSIGEYSYNRADSIAKALGEKLIGKSFEAVGATSDEAEAAARRKAGEEWLAGYLHLVNDTAKRVQELYDQVTDHGRRREIAVSDGIQQAIERYREEKRSNASAAGQSIP